ncbi:MAG: hypothetical protein SAK29_25685 [Scytonema sp. PMC 1069.18]|nr:hypothetical protein [Scytonema sp. PMC 1069.18]MEC4886735.1 hypothetical protein [Scytonema sp. PMC 1070.18]
MALRWINIPPGPDNIPSSWRFSYTSTSIPTSRQARANVKPPIPPPITIAFDIEGLLAFSNVCITTPNLLIL